MRELNLVSVVELSESDVRILKTVLGRVHDTLRLGIWAGREKYLCDEEVAFALSPEEMWDLEEMIKTLEGL